MTNKANVIRLDPDIQRHVRARMARLPAVIHALHESGQKALSEHLTIYFDAVDDALFDLADKAESNQEQNMFFDSMREVRVQRIIFEGHFFDMIEEAFARLVSVDRRDLLVETEGATISLVQHEGLEQLLALEDTVDKANLSVSGSIKGLSSALSNLVPTDVNILNNPFGPSVVAFAAMVQIKGLEIDIKAKLILFKLFDQLVIQALVDVYPQLYDVLSIHGIEVPMAVRKMILSIDQSSAPSFQALAPVGESLSDELTRPELIELLCFIQKLPSSDNFGDSVDIVSVLDKIQESKGRVLKLASIEQETIHIVQMLFQFILQDESMDYQIKALFGRMQIPVLKVALLDNTFLEDKRHPARLLVNEMVSVALHWQSDDEFGVSDPMYIFMKRSVEHIAADFEMDASIFKEVLTNFCSFSDKERRRAAVLEKRIVDAEAGKAKAEQARQKVAEEVVKRTMEFVLPDVIRALIDGPWSNVLFVTGLKYGFKSSEWASQLKILNDLVWSAQPCSDKKAKQKLIRLIPKLTAELRAGFDAISCNPFEVSELFKSLEDIHLARIRGDGLPGDAAPTDTYTDILDEEFDADNAMDELESLMLPDEQGESKALDSSVEASMLSGDDPHMRTVASFSQGAWFSLADGAEELLRCRLAAIIKQTGKYIFVNRHGGKVAEKTQLELALALKDGSLSALDSSMLFDKALENVVAGLRKTSSSKSSMPGLKD